MCASNIGIGDALAHIDLRAEVRNDIEAAVAHDARGVGAREVQLASVGARRNVLAAGPTRSCRAPSRRSRARDKGRQRAIR
jgi:hypothetical protein